MLVLRFKIIGCFLSFVICQQTNKTDQISKHGSHKERGMTAHEAQLISRLMNSDAGIEVRLSKGRELVIDQYPYVVSYGLICGGSILSNSWVLTAAHCGTKFIHVYTGSTYLPRARVSMVKKHFVHPKYDKKTTKHKFDYDFQLLELESPIQFSKTQQPVPMGTDKFIEVGSKPFVPGWKTTIEDGPTTHSLSVEESAVIGYPECRALEDGLYENLVSEKMFCAICVDNEDICHGDSGAPVIHNGYLIGIVLFGIGCIESRMPGVYAKVTTEIKEWMFEQSLENSNVTSSKYITLT